MQFYTFINESVDLLINHDFKFLDHTNAAC